MIAEDRAPAVRIGRIRLLKLLADRYAQDGDVTMSVRACVVSALCEAAIALDIYADDHAALKRLDQL